MDLFPPETPRDPGRGAQNIRSGAAQRPADPGRRTESGAPYDPLAANRARLERMRLRRRRRRIRIAAVFSVALACALAYFTGLYGASIALLGDIVDSAAIALSPGGGYPVATGMTHPLDAQALAGGLAALDERELVLWSSSGRELRRIQHGYGDPCMTAGNTRVCIYNRGSTSLRVEGRRSTLSEKTLSGSIILAEMSPNGSLAVFTDQGLEVYDPLFTMIWRWNKTDALPLAMAFDSGNRKFAAALVSARGGALGTTVYLFETGKSEAVCTIEADDAIPVAMKYLSGGRILCVFDTRTAIYDTSTGEMTASFEYGPKVLQSASAQMSSGAVLLFSDVDVSRHAELYILDETLSVVGCAQLETRTTRVTADRTHAYVLTKDSVLTYALDGTLYGETELDAEPQRLVQSGAKTYLLAGGYALEFTAPSAPGETGGADIPPEPDSVSASGTGTSQAESSASDASAA